MKSPLTSRKLNIQTIDMNGKNEMSGQWKPFIKLLASVKLPYFWIVITSMMMLVSTTLSLLFPQYTQQIMAGDISTRMVILASAVIIGQIIVDSISGFIGSMTTSKISLSFRQYIWDRIVHLPIPFFDKNMPREMISRTTEDTTKLSDLLANFIGVALSSIYKLVGTFVILFNYDWRLAAAEAIIIPLVVLISVIKGKIGFKWNNKIQASLANLTGYLSGILLNLPLMKIFVQEDKEEKRGEECIDKLFMTKFKFNIINSIIEFFNQLTTILQTVIVIVLGIYLISKQIITIDVWIAFYMYAQGLLTSVIIFMDLWVRLKSSQGSVRRITEVSLEPYENYENISRYQKQNSDISFENVSFKYSENYILKNVSFRIPYGKISAIVGPSGVGKTTIFSLIERFYEPNSGTIKHGDTSIRNYNLQDWRKAFSFVSQDTKLFSGTIRDNITYGLDRKVTEEEMIQAAKEAHAMEFITSFEQGFDTEVGETGSKLSGGQRQRIAIARAILQNAEYLLLDEATSSLDTEAEYVVVKALQKLAIGRTTIIIAHRLSTIEEADQIIVLENREVSGTGSHESLIESNELYKRLIDIP